MMRGTRLLIKLGALFSACGGPLVLFDALKPHMTEKLAFGICFFPIALMVFGALTITEDEGGKMERIIVILGCFGAVIALLLHGWGAYVLATTPPRREQSFYVFMVGAGFPISLFFIHASRQWLSNYVQ